jgi:hypothetical protein
VPQIRRAGRPGFAALQKRLNVFLLKSLCGPDFIAHEPPRFGKLIDKPRRHIQLLRNVFDCQHDDEPPSLVVQRFIRSLVRHLSPAAFETPNYYTREEAK